MKEWLSKNKSNIIILVIYASITLITIIFHEQWRDEAQQWLIVKDLSIGEIVSQMKYEGHFILWYLILMPFAKLGFPFITVNIISWLFMLISVWILLTKAPFSKIIKYLLVFTSPFIYYYSVISRVYCLIPLAEMIIAITYKDRFYKPYRYILSLVLLANTHIIMMGQVGILFFEYIIQLRSNAKMKSIVKIKNNIISIILFFILIMISIIPILGSIQSNADVEKNMIISFENIIDILIYEPIKQIVFCFGTYNYISILCISVLAIFLLILIMFFLSTNYPLQAIELLITCLWQYSIYSFIYFQNVWRGIVIIPELIFFMWIINYNNENIGKIKRDMKIKVLAILLLLLNSLNGIFMVWEDIFFCYSDSKKMSKYINEYLDVNSVVISGDISECCSPIIANCDKVDFYSVNLEDYFTYITYSEKLRKKISIEDVEEAIGKFKGKDIYYIYSTVKIFDDNDEEIVKELIDKNILEEVYNCNEFSIMNDEKYILYKVDRGLI